MKNRNLLFPISLIISFILFCGLNCIKSIKDDSIYSSDEAGYISYWFDTETRSVHKMVIANDKTKVVSIIKYDNGTVAEVMEVIKSELADGKVSWAYYVPSTGYTVEMKIVSSAGNEITVKWNNIDADGKVEYGEEVLIRCEEKGNELFPNNTEMSDEYLDE